MAQQLSSLFKHPAFFWGSLAALGGAVFYSSPSFFPEHRESKQYMDQEIQRVRISLGLSPLDGIPVPAAAAADGQEQASGSSVAATESAD